MSPALEMYDRSRHARQLLRRRATSEGHHLIHVTHAPNRWGDGRPSIELSDPEGVAAFIYHGPHADHPRIIPPTL